MTTGEAAKPSRFDTRFWIGVLNSERRDMKYLLLHGFLNGCAGLYCAGLDLYLASETVGIRNRTRLPVAVISIGNLTTGGTGKTPMAQYIARGLAAGGERPIILSRGHGGSASAEGGQVSNGEGDILLNAEEAGDEASLLARMTPNVPVYVGKDRRKSAASALAKFSPDIFVLDDGLQYWQLARDLDIVLLDSRRPFDNGHVLPRGRLREPKSHLRRAGMVVVTRADLASAEQLARVVDTSHRLAPSSSVFLACHRFAGFRPLNSLAEDRLPGRALAVSGIAQPETFVSLLRSAGAHLTSDMVTLEDHAQYDPETVRQIKGKILDCGADSVITTDKDAVKLPAGDFGVPVYSATMQIEIDRPDEFWRELRSKSGLK